MSGVCVSLYQIGGEHVCEPSLTGSYSYTTLKNHIVTDMVRAELKAAILDIKLHTTLKKCTKDLTRIFFLLTSARLWVNKVYVIN